MPFTIKFLGAAQTVTGSKYYVETQGIKFLVDCGMFQGLKDLRLRNWEPLSVDVGTLRTVLLTHGHLDHTGYLPRLVKEGFRGSIMGTAPTLAMAAIILRDSAKIHEEEAVKANAEGYTKHSPALPFYTLEEAEEAISMFKAVDLDTPFPLADQVTCRFRYNGHILGATFIEIDIQGKKLVFSGDIGRPEDLLLKDPERPEWADYLFMESTYGNRLHPQENVDAVLTDLVNETINERGVLLIPAFAVERLQVVMHLLWKLYERNKIPKIPIFIDSPMGSNVLDLFREYPSWHKLPMRDFMAMCRNMKITTSYKDTWKTIDDPRPKVVIAGSGMISGGRILTYLKMLMNKPSTKILLVGYQAEGTRGRQLLDGAQELKIFGKFHELKAKVYHLESLSAHADRKELLNWLKEIKNIPERVFLIHGEQQAMEGLKAGIEERYGWAVSLPKLEETIQLV